MKKLNVVLISILTILLLSGCSTEEKSNSFSGFVEGTVISLSSETGGLVTDVYASKGAEVIDGQVLIVMDKSELEHGIAQAEQGVQASKYALESLLNKPLQSDINAGFSNVEKAEAQKNQLEQYIEMLDNKYISEDEFALMFGTSDPDAALEMADAAIALAKTNWVKASAGASKEEIIIAVANLDVSQANLNLLTAQMNRVDVVSHKNGVLIEVLTNKGAVAAPGQTLVKIMDPEDLSIIIYVPAARISEIEIGNEAKIQVDSYPEESFSGEIVWIAEEAQFTPSSVQTKEERVKLVFAVRIKILDGFDKIKPGIPADVSFEE